MYTVFAPSQSLLYVPNSDQNTSVAHTRYTRNGVFAACLNIAISYVNTDYVSHEKMTHPQLNQIYMSDKILKGISEGMGATDEIRHRLR